MTWDQIHELDEKLCMDDNYSEEERVFLYGIFTALREHHFNNLPN